MMQVFFYGLFITSCPWESLIESRYYMMALVTISTIYQTVFLAYILLLSKGWKIARQSLARSDISKNTLLLAAVYLVYSAYYVSVNIPQMKNFVEVSILD